MDELIFFRQPPLAARLMVYGLDPRVQEDDLRRIFLHFGALLSLDVRNAGLGERQAFVNYFCAASATHAMAEIGSPDKGITNQAAPTLYGRKLQVRFRTRDMSCDGPAGDWLQDDECCRMANYFLGFNGWSTSVREITRILSSSSEADNGMQKVAFREAAADEAPPYSSQSGGITSSHWFAVVDVAIPRFGVKVHGQAYGLAGATIGARDPLEVVGFAKKCAVARARVAALRRVCLVLLDGVCRFAQALPLPEEIETSIVWECGAASKPDKSRLPCQCVINGEENEPGGLLSPATGNMEKILADLDVNIQGMRPRENRVLAEAIRNAEASKSNTNSYKHTSGI